MVFDKKAEAGPGNGRQNAVGSGGEGARAARLAELRQFVSCALALLLFYAIILGGEAKAYEAAGAGPSTFFASLGVSSAVLVGVAAAATWRPSLITPARAAAVCLVLMAGGGALVAAGMGFGVSACTAAGLVCAAVGGGVAALLAKAACVSLRGVALALCIFVSFAAGNALSLLFAVADGALSLVLYFALSILVVLLPQPYCAPLLKSLAVSEAPRTMAAVRPRAFVPFGHQIFIFLALFNFSHGYLMAFTPARYEIDALLTIAVIGLIAALYFANKRTLRPDRLLSVSLLLVVAGYLLAPISDIHTAAASSLLSIGVACFNVLYLYALLTISQKNKLNAIVVLAWGAAVESLSMMAGSAFSMAVTQQFAADHGAVSVVSSAIVLVIVGCVLATYRSFSFDATISGVEAVDATLSCGGALDADTASALSVADRMDIHTALLEARCAEVAKRFGLTPRETEVFALLARGRNSPYIQKKLVITNNTVKVHVRHIYQKLGVDSHQELIDLVERTPDA